MSAEFLTDETARLSVDVVDAAGVPADPPGLQLKVQRPNGAVQTYDFGTNVEIVRDAAGVFHADVALDAAGTWYWRWKTSPPYVGAAEGSLQVMRTRFP